MSVDKDQAARAARSLDDNAKRYFDAVESLRQAAWQSFDRRRAFEWKLSFGLWTALGAIIAGLALGQATLPSILERNLLSILGLAIVALHAWWSFSLDRVNRADLEKSYLYEEEQRRTLGLVDKTTVGEGIRQIVARVARRSWVSRNWGHITQVAVTGILAAGAIALAWLH